MKERKRAFSKDNLRSARDVQGFTQEDVALRLGLDQSQYARYESGESEPSPYIIARIARELNVSTDYLLGVDNDPVSHLREEDLSDAEKKLLSAFRRRDLRDLMKIASEEN